MQTVRSTGNSLSGTYRKGGKDGAQPVFEYWVTVLHYGWGAANWAPNCRWTADAPKEIITVL